MPCAITLRDAEAFTRWARAGTAVRRRVDMRPRQRTTRADLDPSKDLQRHHAATERAEPQAQPGVLSRRPGWADLIEGRARTGRAQPGSASMQDRARVAGGYCCRAGS